jgi:hypothetical protein
MWWRAGGCDGLPAALGPVVVWVVVASAAAPVHGIALGESVPSPSTAIESGATEPSPTEPVSLQRVSQWISELDDAEFAVREAAARRLDADAVPLAALRDRLRDPQLSSEQRQRLLGVVADRILRTPRGALGIRMEPFNRAESGVVVSGFVEGMPAAEVLLVGDRIVSADQVPIADSQRLIEVVQQRQPGETVLLGVVRTGPDGGRMAVAIELTLGSVEQLQQDPNDPLVRQNPVVAQRAREVAELRERFGPTTTGVRVRPAILVPTGPASGVESHPEVVRLRQYLEMAASGALADPEALRQRWQQRVVRIRRDSTDLRVPPAEREQLRAVAERLERMLQAAG